MHAVTTRRSALLVAAFDSQLKWCSRIRDELVARGFDCTAVVPDARSALSPQQVRDAGFDLVEHRSWDEVVEAALAHDVVIASLAGPQTQRLSIELAMASAKRPAPGPVVVSGWVGIIIEKITAGYLDRSGTDVIAVNSVTDLAHFRHAAHLLDIPDDGLVLTGLPFLSVNPTPAASGPIRTLLYADQPTVPASAFERRYVYEKLIDYARAHPDRAVLLKPRHRPEEDTFHRMKHHPADLLAGVELPPNFAIDYAPIAESLPHVDLLLTMSSTASLEAIDFGCRVALVADLGVNERYGNHVFLDSGLLRTFEDITADRIGEVSPTWRASYFDGRDRPPAQVIADRIEKLLATGERPSHAVWASSYFRGSIGLYRAKQAADASAPGLWKRRINQFGGVLGTVIYLANNLLPPIIARPLRRRFRALRAI